MLGRGWIESLATAVDQILADRDTLAPGSNLGGAMQAGLGWVGFGFWGSLD
jgi:hypothetical protein